MKTLNDKRLDIASKKSEKMEYIRKNRDELRNNEWDILEDARNCYIAHFGNNWENWKWDKVIVDSKGYIYWIRTDLLVDHDIILDQNAGFWIYGSTDEKQQIQFYEITENLFNS